jgi:tetratricopeptide (TPR) repeat protein
LDERHTELSDSDLGRLDRCRAAALAAAGDRQAALAHYAALVAQSPDDGELQESYAKLLAVSDSDAELRQAQALWQQVESRSRRGGERWRRARTARIELLKSLGDEAEAVKLVRLTRLLYPDWDAMTAQ